MPRGSPGEPAPARGQGHCGHMPAACVVFDSPVPSSLKIRTAYTSGYVGRALLICAKGRGYIANGLGQASWALARGQAPCGHMPATCVAFNSLVPLICPVYLPRGSLIFNS